MEKLREEGKKCTRECKAAEAELRQAEKEDAPLRVGGTRHKCFCFVIAVVVFVVVVVAFAAVAGIVVAVVVVGGGGFVAVVVVLSSVITPC